MSNKGSVKQLSPLDVVNNKNAIELSVQQVQQLRMNKIMNWSNQQETWSLKYSNLIVCGTTALTGILFLKHHRKLFRLTSGGEVRSIIGAVLVPSTLAGIFEYEYFTKSLFEISKYNLTECLLCKELRTNVILMSIGTVLPATFSWFGSYVNALQYNTYGLPTINKKILVNSKLRQILLSDLRKIFTQTNKKFSNLFMKLFIAQFFVISFLNYYQMKQFFDIEDKLEFSRADIDCVTSFGQLQNRSAISQLVEIISNKFK